MSLYKWILILFNIILCLLSLFVFPLYVNVLLCIALVISMVIHIATIVYIKYIPAIISIEEIDKLGAINSITIWCVGVVFLISSAVIGNSIFFYLGSLCIINSALSYYLYRCILRKELYDIHGVYVLS